MIFFVSNLAAAIPVYASSNNNSTTLVDNNATTTTDIKIYEDGTGEIMQKSANGTILERAQFDWNVTSNHTVIFEDDGILLVEEVEGTEHV